MFEAILERIARKKRGAHTVMKDTSGSSTREQHIVAVVFLNSYHGKKTQKDRPHDTHCPRDTPGKGHKRTVPMTHPKGPSP